MENNIYERILSRIADSKSDVIFYNSGKDHSIIVLKSIFERSKKNINLSFGNFDCDLFSSDDIVNQLNCFFLANGKLNIVLDDIENLKRGSNFLKLLLRFPDNIKVYKSYEKFDYNFLTCDNKMFRYEYDKINYKAEFSFNNYEKAESLDIRFNEIISKSKLINLVEAIENYNLISKCSNSNDFEPYNVF